MSHPQRVSLWTKGTIRIFATPTNSQRILMLLIQGPTLRISALNNDCLNGCLSYIGSLCDGKCLITASLGEKGAINLVFVIFHVTISAMIHVHLWTWYHQSQHCGCVHSKGLQASLSVSQYPLLGFSRLNMHKHSSSMLF